MVLNDCHWRHRSPQLRLSDLCCEYDAVAADLPVYVPDGVAALSLKVRAVAQVATPDPEDPLGGSGFALRCARPLSRQALGDQQLEFPPRPFSILRSDEAEGEGTDRAYFTKL